MFHELFCVLVKLWKAKRKLFWSVFYVTCLEKKGYRCFNKCKKNGLINQFSFIADSSFSTHSWKCYENVFSLLTLFCSLKGFQKAAKGIWTHPIFNPFFLLISLKFVSVPSAWWGNFPIKITFMAYKQPKYEQASSLLSSFLRVLVNKAKKMCNKR